MPDLEQLPDGTVFRPASCNGEARDPLLIFVITTLSYDVGSPPEAVEVRRIFTVDSHAYTSVDLWRDEYGDLEVLWTPSTF